MSAVDRHRRTEAEITQLQAILTRDKLRTGRLRPFLWRQGWVLPPPLFMQISTDGMAKVIDCLLVLKILSLNDLVSWTALRADIHAQVGLLVAAAFGEWLRHFMCYLDVNDAGRVRPWRDYVTRALASGNL